MARIPLVPIDLAQPQQLVEAVRLRRGGKLLELDRLLLHSPPLTEGWNVYLGAVRTKLSIDPKLRELAICAVAVLNRAGYEYAAHLPEFVKAGGTHEQGEAIHRIEAEINNGDLFDVVERATLKLTYEMTRNVQVEEDTFKAAADALGSTTAMVELIGVIATYNMVSRFLVALELHPS